MSRFGTRDGKTLTVATSMYLICSILIISILIFSASNLEAMSDSYKVYTLTTENGKTYRIQYLLANSTMQSLQVDASTGTLTITLDDKFANGDGRLTLLLPRELADKMANIGQLAVFIDDEDADYVEANSNCDYRTISIDFPKGTETIELVGTFADYYDEPHPVATFNLDIDGTRFQVETQTLAKICDLQFIKEEKKLVVHSDNLTGIVRITMPNILLGAPYIVTVDGRQANANVSTNANYTDFTITPENTSKAIEIIGTTAIPEFGSSLSVSIVTVSIASVAVLASIYSRLNRCIVPLSSPVLNFSTEIK